MAVVVTFWMDEELEALTDLATDTATPLEPSEGLREPRGRRRGDPVMAYHPKAM